MTESKIIEKIAKLLRLADEHSGGTEAERDLAMKRAQEMMLKHNLDYAKITGGLQSAEGDVADHNIMVKGAMNQWRLKLLASIGAVTFVNVISFNLGKHHKRVMLVGRPDNLAFTTRLFEALVPWLETECKIAVKDEEKLRGDEFFNPRAFKRSFMESAAYRIHGRLQETRRATKVGTDLVRNEDAANRQHLESLGIKVRRSSARGSGEAAGHRAGREAGGRADLSPGRKLSR